VVELHTDGGPDVLSTVGPFLALLVVLLYLGLAVTGSRQWPRRRGVCWVLGCGAATLAITGPIAAAADDSFAAHMITHVLVGMAAPLLLVLAAPVTLLLRSLPVSAGRRLSRVLSGLPVRVLTEPAVGAVLSVGGLWLLYTTDLYPSMHHQPLLHLLVHLHLFTAGYLFTVAIISVDPLPHRRSFLHRSIVVIMAMAAHDVLAKHLYAHPPAGVAPAAAESGSMIMYYGGDAVDLLLVVLLWLRWYRSRAPRVAPAGPVERRSVAAHVGHESRGGDAR
jgi:putative membrane protein